MNFSGTGTKSLLVRYLCKQCRPFKAPAFTKRNALEFSNKAMVFDGTGQISKGKEVATLVRKSNLYHLSPVPIPHYFSGVWSNHFTAFHTTRCKLHGEYEWQDPKSEEEVVTVQIMDKDGKVNNVRGKIGDNLLYLAKRFEVEMEGACEASLACTTCHVYVDHDYLDLLPEATETEEDLLDQAPFLKENSRLGCQIILSKDLNGIKLSLPAATKNFYVDGHKPTPH